MGHSFTMKVLVAMAMLTSAVSSLEFGHLVDSGQMDSGQVDNDVPSSQYNCPMMDIDLGGNDLDAFSGVDDWQTCAHICNIAYESNCLFWTWSGNATWEEGSWWNNRCLLKSSDSGMRPWPGAISGQRGCL